MNPEMLNRLIDHAKYRPDGFSVELKYIKNKWTIRAIHPTQKKRYAVARKTLVEIYDDHYMIYPGTRQIGGYTPIGGYYNKDKKCYQIEQIGLYEYNIDALFVADYLNQIAIYDLINKREILVKEAL